MNKIFHLSNGQKAIGTAVFDKKITGTFEGSSGYEHTINFDGTLERVVLRRQLSPQIGCIWISPHSSPLTTDITVAPTVSGWNNSAWGNNAIGTNTSTVPNIKAVTSTSVTLRLGTQNTSGTWEYEVYTSGGTIGTDVSDTTAIASDVAMNKIFHLSNGQKAIGTANIGQSVSGIVPWNNGSRTIVTLGWKPKYLCVMPYLNNAPTHLISYDETISDHTIYQSSSDTGIANYAFLTTNNRRIYNITDTGFELNSFGVANGQCYYFAIG